MFFHVSGEKGGFVRYKRGRYIYISAPTTTTMDVEPEPETARAGTGDSSSSIIDHRDQTLRCAGGGTDLRPAYMNPNPGGEISVSFFK